MLSLSSFWGWARQSGCVVGLCALTLSKPEMLWCAYLAPHILLQVWSIAALRSDKTWFGNWRLVSHRLQQGLKLTHPLVSKSFNSDFCRQAYRLQRLSWVATTITLLGWDHDHTASPLAIMIKYHKTASFSHLHGVAAVQGSAVHQLMFCKLSQAANSRVVR